MRKIRKRMHSEDQCPDDFFDMLDHLKNYRQILNDIKKLNRNARKMMRGNEEENKEIKEMMTGRRSVLSGERDEGEGSVMSNKDNNKQKD